MPLDLYRKNIKDYLTSRMYEGKSISASDLYVALMEFDIESSKYFFNSTEES